MEYICCRSEFQGLCSEKKTQNRSGKEFGFRCWSINCSQYVIKLNKFIVKSDSEHNLKENLSRH